MKRSTARLIGNPVTALAVVALSFVLGSRAVLAQGSFGAVNFANAGTFTYPADRRVYDPITCAPLVGDNWVAALYFGTEPDKIDTLAVRAPDNLTLLSAIVRFRNVDSTHSLAGTWVGGLRTLPGVTVGQILAMQVRVWDLSMFATYDDAEALGGYALESLPFSYRISGATDEFGFKINNFLGITPPECIPEPSVCALWTLGVGLLLAWWCKKPKRRTPRTAQ